MIRLASTALLLSLIALASPVSAQERYELTDRQWRQIESPAPDSPEGQLQTVRKAIAQAQFERARKLADRWIKTYPNHPLLAEAYLLRGDARSARGRYYAALYDYEYIIRAYPGSTQFHTALQREFEIARMYVDGLNRRFLGFRMLPAQGDGEELLIRIQERAPGSELGEKASLKLSDYYFGKGDMDLAAEAYDLFLQNYPRSEHREWAMLRLIQASLARFKGPEFDPTGLIEAAQRLRMYREEYPAGAERMGADALLVRIDESLALGDLVTARWYERRGERVSAAYVYRAVVDRYPRTAAARTALDQLAHLDVPVGALPEADE